VDFPTILLVFFYSSSPRTLLQQPWLKHQGQLEEGKRKGGIFPLMLPPSPSFSTGSASVPFVGSGAATTISNVEKHIVLARHQAQDSKYPLWKYVTRHQGPGVQVKGGGNIFWTCNFGKNQFTSTYFRVKGHLLGTPCGLGPCQGVNESKQRELEREAHVGEATSRRPKNEDPLPFLRKPPSNYPFGGGSATTKKRLAMGPMDKIFQQEKRDGLDFNIGFFYYLNFISFNVARSHLFIEMCRGLAQGSPTGYMPPSSKKLRTTFFVKAKRQVDKMLEPIKATWPSSGVSIVSNGWTYATHHPLINFVASSLNGPVFLKAVNALGKYKDAHYMGEEFIKVIEDVGVDSYVQIIVDNARVCKATGMVVEAKYPQVFWTPCIVHSLNLTLKSIALDATWIESLIEDARHIHNFVQNHTNALTIYKKYRHLSLLKIADTRFASSFIMLKKLREVKPALGSMVISDFWSFWRKTDQASLRKVKDTVLDDAWWERVDLTIKIMDPIISLLRFADTDKPILGELYEGC
jgi:hypothetical protein